MQPGDPLCELACEQYAQCRNQNIQVGFTCDATLCTVGCNDQGLVMEACNGLSSCSKDAIMRVEALAQCSCCATQICGCQEDATTSHKVFVLNQRQGEAGVAPQCDIDGSLCGTPRPR